MPDEGWAQAYRRLWNELVPQRGQAETVQGELLRCIGKITDEAYRNGNENWDEQFEKMAQFIGSTLDDPTVFSAGERAKIRSSVDRIVRNPDSPDTSGRGSSYYYLGEKAIEWCGHYKELIPREPDPGLQK
jgi:hypothetical protein